MKLSIEERLLARRTINKETNCWEFTGGRSNNGTGYGVMNISGKTVRVHRLAYELFIGEIPNGQLVLHSCDNRKCFNPEHLSLGNQKENMREMVGRNRDKNRNVDKTECIRGHSLTDPANVRITNNNGARVCLACLRIRRGLEKNPVPDYFVSQLNKFETLSIG